MKYINNEAINQLNLMLVNNNIKCFVELYSIKHVNTDKKLLKLSIQKPYIYFISLLNMLFADYSFDSVTFNKLDHIQTLNKLTTLFTTRSHVLQVHFFN